MLLAVTFHPLRASSPHSHCRVAVVMNGNTVCEMSDTQCVALCFNQTFPFRDLIWFGASFLVFKSLWIYFFSIVQLCHLFNEQTSGNQIKTVMRRFFHSLSDWEHNTNRCPLLTVCFSPLQLKTTAFGRTASPMSVVRCSSKPSTTCWSAASWIAVLFASGSGSWNPTRRTRSPLIRGTWTDLLGFCPGCYWLPSMWCTFRMCVFMFTFLMVGLLDMTCVLIFRGCDVYLCNPGQLPLPKKHVWSFFLVCTRHFSGLSVKLSNKIRHNI